MPASQSRVESMGIIHRKLYQLDNLAAIEMKDYFKNLVDGLLDAYEEDQRIKLNTDMDELELDVDTALPIGLIVHERLTNSIKYAFPHDESGQLFISRTEKENNQLGLTVADNGIGKSIDAAAKRNGFGTQLVDLLTRQMRGTI